MAAQTENNINDIKSLSISSGVPPEKECLLPFEIPFLIKIVKL